jgi:hypothetical protein
VRMNQTARDTAQDEPSKSSLSWVPPNPSSSDPDPLMNSSSVSIAEGVPSSVSGVAGANPADRVEIAAFLEDPADASSVSSVAFLFFDRGGVLKVGCSKPAPKVVQPPAQLTKMWVILVIWGTPRRVIGLARLRSRRTGLVIQEI